MGLLLAGLLSGCADTAYYAQSVRGHLALMAAARPLAQWQHDPTVPVATKERLALAQRMRDFAVQELGLPDNPSYRSYADLQRRSAVWNVVAAPPYALEPKRWCFVLLGCVSYRGYFEESAAQAQAQQLRAQGLETSVYGVPAYSTLGWLNWAGGDPLLNTFLRYPEGELARLLLHELAHQKVYVAGDTAFNESFASAVERIGGKRWLEQYASAQARQAYADFEQRRSSLRQLGRSTRQALVGVYDPQAPWAAEPAERQARKEAVMEQMRARYGQLRAQWDLPAEQLVAYDRWIADTNNASLAAQAVYEDLVPAFEALFAQLCAGAPDCTDDRSNPTWERFYDAVQRLAALPQAQRNAELAALVSP